MTKLNPDHANYPDGTPIEYCDVVTRGKSRTLWEVVETEYPDRLRLSRLGSYGEVNQWVSSADVVFYGRRLLRGSATCQMLLDLQERIRYQTDHLRDGVRYVRRVDQSHLDTAEALQRATHRLHLAVLGHRDQLAAHYGITD